MTLNIQELKDKINLVNQDIDTLRKEPGSDKKLILLTQYQEYLLDELNQLEQRSDDD